MAFINNLQDNFLPSGNPWGDDNISVYSSNMLNRVENLSGLQYPELHNLFGDLQRLYKGMPVSFERNALRKKLETVWREIYKREKREEVTAKERGDNFEQPLPRTMPEPGPKYDRETYEEDLGEEPIDMGDLVVEDNIETEPLFTTPQDEILTMPSTPKIETEEIDVDDLEDDDRTIGNRVSPTHSARSYRCPLLSGSVFIR